uniref:Uncharacterized protein n=1 Tax=Cacopsylla melanoneura TaxID=428564 RepID=A0A8D8RW47_9HEMI
MKVFYLKKKITKDKLSGNSYRRKERKREGEGKRRKKELRAKEEVKGRKTYSVSLQNEITDTRLNPKTINLLPNTRHRFSNLRYIQVLRFQGYLFLFGSII